MSYLVIAVKISITVLTLNLASTVHHVPGSVHKKSLQGCC